MEKVVITDLGCIIEQLDDQLRGASLNSDHFVVPDRFGEGFVKRFKISENWFILPQCFTLTKPLTIERQKRDNSKQWLCIIFQLDSTIDLNSKERREKKQSVRNKLLMFNNEFDYKQTHFPYTKSENIHIYISYEELSAFFIKFGLDKSDFSFLFKDIPWYSVSSLPLDILLIIQQYQQREESNYFKLVLRRHINELMLLYVLEDLIERNSKRNTPFIHNEDLHVINEIQKDIINLEMSELTISSICENYPMSKRKIERLFKEVYGDSMKKYRNTMRMNQAYTLIVENKLNANEIGEKLGFSSKSQFYKAIKTYFDKTPEEIRKLKS